MLLYIAQTNWIPPSVECKLRGSSFGQVVGIMIVLLDAIRWFLFLPGAPIVAVVVITIDLIAVYGLSVSGAYFETNEKRPS